MKLDVRETAARFLTYRSHTVAEMRSHLQHKGFDDDEIETLINDYIYFGYLDDQRYCQEYFDYAFSKGKGKRVVFAELKEKGIDSETIQIAFEDREEPYDERSRAWEEAAKVLRMADVYLDEDNQVLEECKEKIEEKLVAKVARRLQSKGYSSDTIFSVIGELRR